MSNSSPFNILWDRPALCTKTIGPALHGMQSGANEFLQRRDQPAGVYTRTFSFSIVRSKISSGVPLAETGTSKPNFV